MNSVFIFLIKQYWSFLLLCLFSLFFSVSFSGVWSILPFIFLILFFYEWNILAKQNNLFNCVEFQNISKLEKVLLQIVFPFIFSFIVLFAMTFFKKNSDSSFLLSFSDSIRISSIFLVSSVLSYSLFRFFILIIFNYIVCYLFSFYPMYELAFFVVYISISCYFVLGKNINDSIKNKAKFIFIISSISVCILFFGFFIRTSLYKIMLVIPFDKIKINVAHSIIKESLFVYEAQEVSGVEDKEKDPYSSMLSSTRKIDDGMLEKLENVVLDNLSCNAECFLLAQTVAHFPQAWNLLRIGKYLDSEKRSEQFYALVILSRSPNIIYKQRIIEISEGADQELRSLAAQILQLWDSNKLNQRGEESLVF